MGEWIELGDGSRAWRTTPSTDQGSGVLLLHAWWGLNETVRGFADRLAERGFVVLAPDLFEGALADTIEDAERLGDGASVEGVSAIVEAAIERLRGEPGVRSGSIGVIGFSFGAAFALLAAARDTSIAAAVACYGTGGAIDWSASEAAVQGHFAENDPYEGTDNIDELEAAVRGAGLRVEIHRYPGTSHWFMEPDRPEYDQGAADLAWGRIGGFLRERLD
jgi:carboxymethylenebutenolidase